MEIAGGRQVDLARPAPPRRGGAAVGVTKCTTEGFVRRVSRLERDVENTELSFKEPERRSLEQDRLWSRAGASPAAATTTRSNCDLER